MKRHELGTKITLRNFSSTGGHPMRWTRGTDNFVYPIPERTLLHYNLPNYDEKNLVLPELTGEIIGVVEGEWTTTDKYLVLLRPSFEQVTVTVRDVHKWC